MSVGGNFAIAWSHVQDEKGGGTPKQFTKQKVVTPPLLGHKSRMRKEEGHQNNIQNERW